MSKFQILADKTAISLSFVCTLHCLALPVLLLSVPSLASLPLEGEAFHRWLLVAVIPISIFALFMGCKKHRRMPVAVLGGLGLAVLIMALFVGEVAGEFYEKALTLLGAVLIAMGHFWNYRLCQSQQHCACPESPDSDTKEAV